MTGKLSRLFEKARPYVAAYLILCLAVALLFLGMAIADDLSDAIVRLGRTVKALHPGLGVAYYGMLIWLVPGIAAVVSWELVTAFRDVMARLDEWARH